MCAERRGYTLLEVLVTVALLTIVIGIAASALIGTAWSAPRTRLQAAEETEIMRVTSVLRRQMLTIAKSNAATACVFGRIGRAPRRDELDMTTSSLLHAGGVGRAEWRIVDDGAATYLAYRESPYVGTEAVSGHRPFIPFSHLVRGLQAQFWVAPAWIDGWSKEEAPERMRLILWYESLEGPRSFSVEAAPGIGQLLAPE